ncbi:MAG: dihydropteroate synthase [Oscillospiraceae bacterium]|nr:dihydropteroate synthase [Oscillospiraceae bacterium]
MQIGNKNFELENHCYLMGILNLTPDSFSDGGQFNDLDKALRHVNQMIADGMDILDIGGESTRPGYTKISISEEIERTAPVIAKIKENFDIPVSLDTYKYQVAQAGIQAGADMINDIWGLQYDNGEMMQLLARTNLPCCLMHNRKHDKNYKIKKQDFFAAFLQDMQNILDTALATGIRKSNILLDPGVGFAKSYENNLEVIDKLDQLRKFLDCPVLLGTSRKSVIGLTLDLPVSERLEGTLATTVIAVMKGASFVRVHDIKENARVIQMTEAIMKG